MRTLTELDSHPIKKYAPIRVRTVLASFAALYGALLPGLAYADANVEIFAPLPSDIVFSDGSNVPSVGSTGGVNYAVVNGHAIAQGDIVLGQVNAFGQLLANKTRGLGVSSEFDRWSNGIIPYQFSPQLSESVIAVTRKAIEHWNTRTAITLVELNDENRSQYPNYLTFEASNGCASFVGMRGGEQQLWISSSCGQGNIIHEIGHAVGLFHEHTRNDRDAYISLQMANIKPGKEFNFDILDVGASLLGEYDYGSIMHYGETFFSANGLATIKVLDGVSKVGQRQALSDRDIRSANSLYETDVALSVDASTDSATNLFRTDILVTNQGAMGAKQLSLTFDAGGKADWTSMSTGSGWECRTRDTELVCTLDVLEAGATIAFTALAEANGADENTASASVITTTQETNYDNNAFNTIVPVPTAPNASSDPSSGHQTFTDISNTTAQPDTTSGSQSGEANGESLPENPNTPQPQISASLPSQTSGSKEPTAASGPKTSSSGGGAISPLLLLLGWLNLRRRKR